MKPFPALRAGLFLTSLCMMPAAFSAARPIHPGYMHALVELHEAQQLLGSAGRAPHSEREKAASQVEAAIWQIEQAAMIPMKTSFHPAQPASAHQLKDAVALLQKAQADCEGEFDDLENPGVRDRALRHISAAMLLTARVS